MRNVIVMVLLILVGCSTRCHEIDPVCSSERALELIFKNQKEEFIQFLGEENINFNTFDGDFEKLHLVLDEKGMPSYDVYEVKYDSNNSPIYVEVDLSFDDNQYKDYIIEFHLDFNRKDVLMFHFNYLPAAPELILE